ncbi:hypothetical protein niasHS_015090 [Heterodera schachtii]|uniref:C3H1-type domain-containing protein n=1 Tax=Heterodera schachtii TaxID=97005 RepID=A0ABD2I9Q4_HETSC
MFNTKSICWFFNMTATEKRIFLATFVCLFAHLTLAVFHIFPASDAISEHGFALALFQLLEALVNLSTIWAQIKQSVFLTNTNSSLLDGKNREIKELKSQLNRSKETNKMMGQNIIHLQQQVHLLTQKLEDEEKRANILAKTYGDTQKKLARSEVRLRHAQRTVQELEADNFELNNELERWRNMKQSSVTLDDGLEVWDNDEENKTEDEEEMRELEEPGKGKTEQEDEHMELLQREIDNLLTDSGTFSSRSCDTNGVNYCYQNNGTTVEESGSAIGSFDIFGGFSPFIKASLSRSQSESKPTNSFGNLPIKPPTLANTHCQFNYNNILATLGNGIDYHRQNSGTDEGTQFPVGPFGVFAGFSSFSKPSLSRSQSESKPTNSTNSFANIAAKPPTAANTQYNYNQELRMIMPQPSVVSKKNSPTSQNDKRMDKLENGETNTSSLCGDEEEKTAKNYLHKTQICLFWKAYVSGKSRTKCRNGVNCNFAHGEKELKKLDPFYFKTELCEFWNSDEPCPYGDGCNFAHGPDELRQMGVKGPKSVAKAPSFYNNRQRLRKTRTKTQTIQPLASYGKPVEQKVTIINGH